MNTRASSGISGGVILTVVGAILYYAVETTVQGIDIATVGVICMIAGFALVVFGLIAALSSSRPKQVHTHSERRVDGNGVVEDRDHVVS